MVLFRRLESGAFKNYYPARVVKLVDTGDLKSPDYCSRAGSIPASGTTIKIDYLRYFLNFSNFGESAGSQPVHIRGNMEEPTGT